MITKDELTRLACESTFNCNADYFDGFTAGFIAALKIIQPERLNEKDLQKVCDSLNSDITKEV